MMRSLGLLGSRGAGVLLLALAPALCLSFLHGLHTFRARPGFRYHPLRLVVPIALAARLGFGFDVRGFEPVTLLRERSRYVSTVTIGTGTSPSGRVRPLGEVVETYLSSSLGTRATHWQPGLQPGLPGQ